MTPSRDLAPTRRYWRLAALVGGVAALARVPALVMIHRENPEGPTPVYILIAVLFVLAEVGAILLLCRSRERAHASARDAQARLADGRRDVADRLAETARIRSDLIGTVSHEFRTPLTGIRGATLTLLKRGDRLDRRQRDDLLHAILDQQERLSRLMENMLVAARATRPDADAVAEVDAVATEVAMLAAATRSGRAGAVSVLVESGTVAAISRQALHQILDNLVDNALQHGAEGTVPLVAGGADRDGVWLTVSNEGRVVDGSNTDWLFQPFTQAESGATRGHEGLGMGLYVVQRLVEVYSGTIDVRTEGGWVTASLRLPHGAAEAAPRRRDLPGPRDQVLSSSRAR